MTNEFKAVETYQGLTIAQLPSKAFIVVELPRRGHNEFGFRYVESARGYIAKKLVAMPEFDRINHGPFEHPVSE